MSNRIVNAIEQERSEPSNDPGVTNAQRPDHSSWLSSPDHDNQSQSSVQVHKLSEAYDRVSAREFSQENTPSLIGGGYGFDTVVFDGNQSELDCARSHHHHSERFG